MELEREFAETYGLTSHVAKEVSMIEVTIHDVMLRAPKDDPEAAWLPALGKKNRVGFTRVVLLKEKTGDRVLPIWVGAVEGNAVAMLLAGLSTNRPMTFELMTHLLDLAKMTVEKVAVTSLRDKSYYATLWVRVRGRLHELDSRPSDALILALRMKAPIFVTPEVLENNRTVLTTEGVLAGLEAIHRKVSKKNARWPRRPKWSGVRFALCPRATLIGSNQRRNSNLGIALFT
jgi:uncharacterized protein